MRPSDEADAVERSQRSVSYGLQGADDIDGERRVDRDEASPPTCTLTSVVLDGHVALRRPLTPRPGRARMT